MDKMLGRPNNKYTHISINSKCSSNESSGEEDSLFDIGATNKGKNLKGSQEVRDKAGRFDFLFLGLGAVVGLGNIWRFPYICYRNGGGVFLIPYLLMVIFFATPFLLAESAFGQYSGNGPVIYFAQICPIFKGAGYSIVVMPVLAMTSYNILIAWSLYYFGHCFTEQVPWAQCNHTYNSKDCMSYADTKNKNDMPQTNLVENITETHNFDISKVNGSGNMSAISTSKVHRVSAAEEFFTRKMLGKTSSMEDFGDIQWTVFLCCVITWTIVFFTVIGGISKTIKVVYFTATFPYVILAILLGRAVTLDGAWTGIYYFILPDWSKLFVYNVWIEAATQVMYSASLASTISTLASYSNFNNNFIRDGVFILIANSLTSLICGLTVFSILGFMAKNLGTEIDNVVQSGAGLAYIAFPNAFSLMPFPQFWSAAFFLTLFLLGIDSTVAGMEVIITGLQEIVPKSQRYKKHIISLICLSGILSSLLYVNGAGVYYLDLINTFAPVWPHLIILLLEGIIILFAYGVKKLLKNVDQMLNSKFSESGTNVLLVKIAFLLAFSTAVVLLLTSFSFFVTPKSGDYSFPRWAEAVGYSLLLVPLLPIIIMACHEIFKSCKLQDSFRKNMDRLFSSTPQWNAFNLFTDE